MSATAIEDQLAACVARIADLEQQSANLASELAVTQAQKGLVDGSLASERELEAHLRAAP